MVTEAFWASFPPEARQRMEANQARYREAGEELFSDLASLGVFVESLDDLTGPGLDGAATIDTLLRWYGAADYVELRRDIARTLGEPWARPALKSLLSLFVDASDEDVANGLRETLASSIARLADESILETLLGLVKSPGFGVERGLLIAALPRMKKQLHRVAPVLLELLGDPQVATYAAKALGDARVDTAAQRLADLVEKSSSPELRREAKEALRKILHRRAGS
jgi:HEAT repeat protein